MPSVCPALLKEESTWISPSPWVHERRGMQTVGLVPIRAVAQRDHESLFGTSAGGCGARRQQQHPMRKGMVVVFWCWEGVELRQVAVPPRSPAWPTVLSSRPPGWSQPGGLGRSVCSCRSS